MTPAPPEPDLDGAKRPGYAAAAATALALVPALAAAAGGATTPYWGAAWTVCAAAVAGTALLVLRRSPSHVAVTRAEGLALALVLFAALFALPLPAAVVEALAPYTASSRVRATGSAAGALSLDAGATASGALTFLGVGLVAVAARRVVDGGGAIALARGLALFTAAHAVAAWLRGRYGEDDVLLLGWPVRNALNAWGTFPNRTLAAAYLLAGATGGVALLSASRRCALDVVLGAACLAAVATSVVASGSRAGVAGVALAAATVVVLAQPTPRRRALAALVGALLVLGPVLAGVLSVGPLKGVMALRVEEGLRPTIWAGTLALHARQPAGIGLEAFPYAYPGEGRRPDDRWAGIAENDVLQGVAELGVLGAVVAALAAAAALRSLRANARPGGRRVSLALAGLLATLPLAATGSPYHCPAVACAAVVAWALGRGLVRGPDRDDDGEAARGYALPTSEAPWRAS